MRAREAGSIVSFILIGVLLFALVLGGAYFVRNGMAGMTKGTTWFSDNTASDTTDKTEQSTKDSQKTDQQKENEAAQKKAETDAEQAQAEQKAVEQKRASEAENKAVETAPATEASSATGGNLPSTGPAETTGTLFTLALMAALVTRYRQSRRAIIG